MNIYILVFWLLFTVFSSSLLPGSHPEPKTEKAGNAKMVFKSTDGGQTWQDISKGLPENLREDSIRGNSFFANDKGLFLKVGNELYHSTPNATVPFWTKEIVPDKDISNTSAKSGIVAYNYWGANLKKTNGMSVWTPIFEIFQRPGIRSVLETAKGSIFIGTDRGFFRSIDNGKTWKHVHIGSLVGHLAESDGVLLAISMRRIIRSTDNGENWAVVISDSSVAWDVKPIKGGFVAITSSSESGTRSLRTSYDAGKTWQPIDVGAKVFIDSIWRTWDDRPRVQAYATSITQVGENFFCTHPDGIFRSSDKGKTWKLLLPSVKNMVFNLFVSGNAIYVIYAIPSKGGC
ncbi:WD40/YVTN/BNR-like repeat-containing protein [Flavihumibacter fluvii]|uniref:WD40/YVTN/BNR-like repeat-containing protein n=1 Tax=Flavihumibacter fluvii TaxID=2838157 RepID=UPI001BDEA2F2|nr:sialidase family protein [Flavihumibacter fluvii]ULQ53378.1 glycoside hydrolase [Flavihumibacter fluvii]